MAKTWQEIDEIGRMINEYCNAVNCEDCIICEDKEKCLIKWRKDECKSEK